MAAKGEMAVTAAMVMAVPVSPERKAAMGIVPEMAVKEGREAIALMVIPEMAKVVEQRVPLPVR